MQKIIAKNNCKKSIAKNQLKTRYLKGTVFRATTDKFLQKLKNEKGGNF